MNAAIQSKIEDHCLVPLFDLPATGGRRVTTWSYKGRMNLVILFPGLDSAEVEDQLRKLAGLYQRFRDNNTEILVVSEENTQTLERLSNALGLPFPLISDIDGSVRDAYTTRTPAVFVIDRYGELYTQSTAETDGEFPDSQQILDWLHLIELQCPECGVPTWVG
jgi:peroxiredoxin